MGRLKAAMTARFKDRDEDVKIHTPRNLETLELSFRGERVAKVSTFGFESYGFINAIASRRLVLWLIKLLKKMTLFLGCLFQRIILTLFSIRGI
jgi:hypothetical protein